MATMTQATSSHPAGISRSPVSFDDTPKLDIKKHTKYFLRCLKTYLPQPYTSNDSNRMSLAFFVVAALDLLGQLDSSTTPEERRDYIDWIYHNQHPKGGFRASPGMDLGNRTSSENECWDPANLPSTYFALCLLLLLGDDFSRVKRKETLDWLPQLQRPDGSFGETLVRGEVQGGTDSRFGYCAAGVRYILASDKTLDDGHKDFDVDKMVHCIREAETYDGGIADLPFHEAHAGFTFCGVGILSFLDRLSSSHESLASSRSATNGHTKTSSDRISGLRNPHGTLRWLMSRQTATITDEDDFDTNGDETDTSATCHDAHSFVHQDTFKSETGKWNYDTRPSSHFELNWTGFNGRCNKIADTCYAFWVGGALNILGHGDLPAQPSLRKWLLERTAHLALGGFGKHAGDLPDIYHGSLGLAALSLMGLPGLKSLDGTMCISNDAKDRLPSIWKSWGIDV